MKAFKLSVSLLLVTLAVGRAQVVVSYAFPGASVAPTTVTSGVTASDVNNTGSSLNTFTPSTDHLEVTVTAGSTTAAAAVTNAQFFQFTVSPPANTKFNLSALVFQAARLSASTPRGWVVRSSQDGFAADLATSDAPSQLSTYNSFSTILPTASFIGIAAPVTFRIYSYAPAASFGLAYDNIQLLGIVDRPPVVAVFSEKKVKTTKTRLRLTGVAVDDIGIAGVTVNGAAATGKTSWRGSVKLTRRTTKIKVLATDTSGLVSTPFKITVTRVDL